MSRSTLCAAILLLAAACSSSDPRTGALTVGITKDSARAVMGASQPHELPYLVNGHYIEALLYAREGQSAQELAESAPRSLTPLVVVDGQLTGWGWSAWDSVAAANGIEVPPKK